MTRASVRRVTNVPALGSIVVFSDSTARTADGTTLTNHDLFHLHRAVEQAMWASNRQAEKRRSLRRPTAVAADLEQLADRN
ncbi:hypothetical protein ACFWGD_11185 [Corynebacterium sp. NPDC060344]|uniref:hypothetical protein n=1 Tax=Corynebacterium sp. NPDC060344 TaxID=3347101 RepID=UPI0036565B3D